MDREYHALNSSDLGITPFGMEVLLCDHHTMGGTGRGEGGGILGDVRKGNESESGREVRREAEGSCMWVCVCVCV